MAARAAARNAARWSHRLRSILTHDLSTRCTSQGSETLLVSAAAIIASATAATTAWAAAADPATPIPGPSPYAESPTSANEGTGQWRVFTDMARDLARQGRQEDAERYLKRALEAAKKGFGETDPHVASACQNLAECYRIQKKYDLAGPLYDQALAILGEAYGPRDIRVAFALHNVAGYYFAQKNWDKASQYYEQALQVKIASVGPGHTETSNTQFHLSEVRWAQGRRKEAMQLAKQSLDAMEQQQASDAACARRRMRLADMLMEEKKFAEAEPLLKKVLTEANLEGLGRVPASEKLARALKEMGKYEEAGILLEDAIKRRKEHGGGAGAEHPATAAALRQLAEVRLAMLKQKMLNSRPAELAGMQLKAVEAAEESLKIAEKAFASVVGVAVQKTPTLSSSSHLPSSTSPVNADMNMKSSKSHVDENSITSSTASWFKNKLSSFGKSTTNEEQALAALAKTLKAVKPEVAYLELALSITTQVEVEKSLGSFKIEELDGELQRALLLVTSDWPGSTGGRAGGGADGAAAADGSPVLETKGNSTISAMIQTSGYSNKIDEMRHHAICTILQARFDLMKESFGAKSSSSAEVAAALTQFNCKKR